MKLYDRFVDALAWLAGALLFLMMLFTSLDVLLRNLGTQGSAHFFTFTEYALLLVPLLGSPWLVRNKGHVFVEILTTSLPDKKRQQLARLTCLLCVFICLVLAYFGVQIAWDDYQQATKDVRSLDMPRWLLTIFFPLGFGLMAFEFARFAVRKENYLESAAEQILSEHHEQKGA